LINVVVIQLGKNYFSKTLFGFMSVKPKHRIKISNLVLSQKYQKRPYCHPELACPELVSGSIDGAGLVDPETRSG
jgi:hypothetical protein